MGKARDKQLGALSFCAFSVPAIVFLPQTGWEGVLLVAVGTLLVVTFGKTVTDTPRLLALPVILWNVLIMGKLARELAGIYETANPLPGLLVLLLAAYGVKKQVLPVAGAVLGFFIIGIYGILYLFAIPDIDLRRLVPEREEAVWGLAYGFLPLLLLYMYKGEEKKHRCLWTGMGAILALGAAVITEGLGAKDFYMAAKSVNLFGTMERLEPFVASAVTVGGFCILGMLMNVNASLWPGIRKEKKKYPLEWMIVPSLALCILAPEIPEKIWALGTTLCWGLIPVATQFVGNKKKI